MELEIADCSPANKYFRQALIYLGIVAARSPGWVRDEFLPFLNVLRDSGFDINPNLLFRSVTAIAAGKTRFRDIPDNMWDAVSIEPAWKHTQKAWKSLVKRLAEYGVLSNEPLPTEAALVTLVSLQHKFQDEPSFDLPFYWLLQASRFGRYSASGATALDEDLRSIGESTTLRDATAKLLEHFEHKRNIEPDDFMTDYGDSRFGRFLLYLLVWSNDARDWDAHGYRLGFEGAQVLNDFQPQWHHIFPKKFLGAQYPAPRLPLCLLDLAAADLFLFDGFDYVAGESAVDRLALFGTSRIGKQCGDQSRSAGSQGTAGRPNVQRRDVSMADIFFVHGVERHLFKWKVDLD